MTIDSDRDYLAGLRSRRTTVSAQVEKLAAQLSAIDKAIAGLAALIEDEAPIATENAPHEQRPLWEEAQALLREQQDKAGMQAAAIVAGLKERGVQINSPTPATIVFSALSRRPDVFAKLKRGVWGLVEDQR